MQNEDKNAVARRHLDARLNRNAPLDSLQRPPKGWVKAIRESLGMTTAQLARRIGIAQSSVVTLEQSEALGRIRLDTLQRVASALDCRLVYALVPNQPLESLVQSRRRELAEHQMAAVEQSMRLENQSVEDQEAKERHLRAVAERISAKTLWEEPQ
jgi:predicted DNA-binding mobile mystery protein A